MAQCLGTRGTGDMMKRYWLLAAFAWAVVTCNAVQAQDFKAPWEEFDKRLKASQAVGALNDELFGDSVNLPEGSLSFSATDVDLPGNDRSEEHTSELQSLMRN